MTEWNIKKQQLVYCKTWKISYHYFAKQNTVNSFFYQPLNEQIQQISRSTTKTKQANWNSSFKSIIMAIERLYVLLHNERVAGVELEKKTTTK